MIRRSLTDEGVALVHFIGRPDGPGTTNAWLRKYIFPGGYSPALSEVVTAIERCGLWITDIEFLRMHYAWTLRHWRERFLRNWDQARALYDERFCRMWEFYLAGCEMTFATRRMACFRCNWRSGTTACLTHEITWPRRKASCPFILRASRSRTTLLPAQLKLRRFQPPPACKAPLADRDRRSNGSSLEGIKPLEVAFCSISSEVSAVSELEGFRHLVADMEKG